MLAALVVSALSFNAKHALTNTKQRDLLTLRGGAISTDALINTVAILHGASGLATWVAPKTNLEGYGYVGAPTDKELFLVRSTGAIQIALMVALMAGKADFNMAALTFFYGHAIQCLGMMPTSEAMNGPTNALGGCAVLFVTLSALTQFGVLPAGVLSNVAIFFYAVISAQEMLLPKPTLGGFGFGREQTPGFMFIFRFYSSIKLQLGAFILVSKLTGQVGYGLAAVQAVGMAYTIMGFLIADKTGYAKMPLLFWSAVYGGIGLLAYKSVGA